MLISMRCEITVNAHARIPFLARDEKNDSDYMVFFSSFSRAENPSLV